VKKNVFVSAIILIILVIGYQFFKSADKPVTRVILADPETERIISTGSVIGFKVDDNAHAWLGIPYAKAPVGDLRWKAPRPAEKWEGLLEATEISPVCTQFGGPMGNVDEDRYDEATGIEDCLFLNVWAPRYAPEDVPQGKERLPVMMWIHGGGNSVGQGGSYNGKAFASKYNVILVTINYRLGPFGWFSHPALRGENVTPEDKSGNYGTLDIIRALAWIKENISSFGGDPGNVTAFGESAGGRNAISMLLSPKAKGLFHKAVSQSGSSKTTEISKAENYIDADKPGDALSSREIINNLLIADNIVSDRKSAVDYQNKMSNHKIAEYLRSKSNLDLLSAYKPGPAGMIFFFPQLTRDGAVLPYGEPLSLFKDKSGYNAVPIILGTNRDEFKLFMMQDKEYVNIYLKMFFRVKDKKYYDLAASYTSDAWKATGADEIASVLRKTQGPDVFVYRFDWDEEPTILGMDMSRIVGAGHGFEIPFVFNDFDNLFAELDLFFTDENHPGRKALSDSISSYWAEFAYTGSPGKGRDGTEIEWESWDNSSTESDKFIVFDTARDQGIRMSFDAIFLEDLKKKIFAENGFPSKEKKCKIYWQIFKDTDLWDNGEYEKLGCN